MCGVVRAEERVKDNYEDNKICYCRGIIIKLRYYGRDVYEYDTLFYQENNGSWEESYSEYSNAVGAGNHYIWNSLFNVYTLTEEELKMIYDFGYITKDEYEKELRKSKQKMDAYKRETQK